MKTHGHTELAKAHRGAAQRSTVHTRGARAYKGNTVQHTAQQSKAEQRTTATAADSHNTRCKHRRQPNTLRIVEPRFLLLLPLLAALMSSFTDAAAAVTAAVLPENSGTHGSRLC